MDPIVSSPLLSSPKLVCASPFVESTNEKVTSEVKNLPSLTAEVSEKVVEITASSSSSSSSSSNVVVEDKTTPDQLIARLERDLEISQARNSHLTRSLADSRRQIHEHEQLLLRLQWDPKDDYYAYRNPAKGNADAKYLDKQETKMKSLIDQMRVMQRVLDENKSEIQELKAKVEESDKEKEARELLWANSLRNMQEMKDSPSTASPFNKKQRVKSPSNATPTISSSGWARSPSATPPVNSPAPSQTIGKSPRWWLWKKFTPTNSPAPSFWRSGSAQSPAPEHLNLSGSVSSPAITHSVSNGKPSFSRGRSSISESDLPQSVVAMNDSMSERNVPSPAISSFSSMPIRQSA